MENKREEMPPSQKTPWDDRIVTELRLIANVLLLSFFVASLTCGLLGFLTANTLLCVVGILSSMAGLVIFMRAQVARDLASERAKEEE